MPARTAIKIAAAVLSGGVLAGCYVDVGALQHHTSRYPVSGLVKTLAVNDHVGKIRVIGSDSGRVSVTEHLTFRHTAPVTTHRISAGILTLGSRCPALETCSVGYDVTVPRAVTVRVSDSVGTIRLESLSGQVTARTNVGGIDLGSVSGPIEVTGRAGSILGQNVSSGHATLRLSAGRIDVTFSAAPTAITATTGVGSITLRVPGNVSYAIHAGASVGNTAVSVSRNPASPHSITASTRTGSITIEPGP